MYASLGLKLQAIRLKKGLTLMEASEKLGINRHTLSRLESGMQKPTGPTLRKLSSGYDIPIEDILEELSPLGQAPSPSESPEEAPEARPVHVLKNADEYAERFDRFAEDFENVILPSLRAVVRCERLDNNPAFVVEGAAAHYYNFADGFFHLTDEINAVEDAVAAGEDVPPELVRAARRLWRAMRAVQGIGPAAWDATRPDSPVPRLKAFPKAMPASERRRQTGS